LIFSWGLDTFAASPYLRIFLSPSCAYIIPHQPISQSAHF
jgi:hypothetical protein